jgi:hypothetical protein
MKLRPFEAVLVVTGFLALAHCSSDGTPSAGADPHGGIADRADQADSGAPTATALVTAADLHCVGAWRTPDHTTSTISVSDPMALRRTGGQRQYFLYGAGGNDHVYSMVEPPSLAPCNTAVSSLPVGTLGDDWGAFKVAQSEGYVPGQNAAFAFGLSWDPVEERLVLSWAGTYAAAEARHGFASASLNESAKTLTIRGCWGLKDQATQRFGSGMLPIPAAWAHANGLSTHRWAVGLGGHVGYTVGNSYGPTLFALTPPADNHCNVTDGDNLIATADYTPLALFPWNENGPRCYGDALGCTPTQAPTAPYPAKMQFNAYSGTYSDWEPYDGHGWYGFGTTFQMVWYDDGSKRGVLVPMRQQSGWIHQEISASPAPSVTGGGTFPILELTLPSLDTHDGSQINVGDWMWIPTCTPIDSPGCEKENSRYLSMGPVTRVDRAAKRVAIAARSLDYTSGPHTPIVGGKALFGCHYAHGSPTCSRGVYRMQVIDPAEYAAVASGKKKANEPSYESEFDITHLIPNHGSPASGEGVLHQGVQHAIVSVMPDPAAHQILVAIGEQSTTGNTFKSVYVWEVAH